MNFSRLHCRRKNQKPSSFSIPFFPTSFPAFIVIQDEMWKTASASLSPAKVKKKLHLRNHKPPAFHLLSSKLSSHLCYSVKFFFLLSNKRFFFCREKKFFFLLCSPFPIVAFTSWQPFQSQKLPRSSSLLNSLVYPKLILSLSSTNHFADFIRLTLFPLFLCLSFCKWENAKKAEEIVKKSQRWRQEKPISK